jgi:hypothetical protein
LSASARSSFFCLWRARWSRASSVSRHDLHVAAIPAAQAINTIHQLSAIHEEPAAKKFVIRMCSSLRLGENRLTCGTAGTKVTEVLYRHGTKTRTMRTGNRRQRQQAAGEEILGPPLSLSVFRPLSLCHRGVRGVRLGMIRIHPERPASDLSDHSLAADVLLRQEPDEEEDEEEDEGDGKEDDNEDGVNEDGYSE